MKVLTLNAGSSSVKYQLIDTKNSSVLANGLIDSVGANEGLVKLKTTNDTIKQSTTIEDHNQAFGLIFDSLIQYNVISSLDEIDAVAHRVVHGGDEFSKPVLVDDKVLEKLSKLNELAPLHNPVNIEGIIQAQKFTSVPNVIIFDTAFHSSIPSVASTYALPSDICKADYIKRYGFHGTSHKFITSQVAQLLKKPQNEVSTIICHLGNGASICAVKDGQSIDTSMGFTPLEGLVMGTRSGDMDPAILFFLAKKHNMNIDELDTMINKESGLKGICGINDMRDIEDKMFSSPIHALAFDIFCYRVQKYIGAYMSLLPNLDMIVFTGGIGENSFYVRDKVLGNMAHMGIILDSDKNNTRGECIISASESNIQIAVISTNEELQMSLECENLLANS